VGLGDPRPTPTQARSSEPLDEGIPTAPQNFPATRPDQHTRRIKRPAAARVFIFSLFFSKFSVLVESSSASCNILPETVTQMLADVNFPLPVDNPIHSCNKGVVYTGFEHSTRLILTQPIFGSCTDNDRQATFVGVASRLPDVSLIWLVKDIVGKTHCTYQICLRSVLFYIRSYH
jgi:hypothetical protein